MTTTWWNRGSARRGDYETGLESLHTDLDFESEARPEEIAKLIDVAQRACYVLSSLERPPSPTKSFTVNGEPFT